MPKRDFNKVDFINFRKNFHHEQLRMFHKKKQSKNILRLKTLKKAKTLS